MNLAVVCRQLGGQGSVASVASRQAEQLAANSTILMISDSFPLVATDWAARVLVKAPEFKRLRRFGHVLRELAFALGALRLVRRSHAKASLDAVICHAHTVAAVFAIPFFGIRSIPVVLVTHGVIFDRPKGTYGEPLESFYRLVTPIAHRRSQLVIALSPRMAELCVAHGARPESVHVIPNGIDPVEIGCSGDDAPRSCSVNGLELGFVGRLSIEKGVDVLLHAVARVRNRGLAVRLRLVGEGRDQERLASLAADLDIADVVSFIGQLPRDELGSFYRDLDVLCVPSRSEPFGLVAIEAMACGTPVVVSDAGGLPWIVGEDAGVVTPREDVDALASELLRLAAHPADLENLRVKSRLRAAEFAWTRIGVQLDGLLTGVVRG